MSLSLIVAMTPERVIGQNDSVAGQTKGKLLWRIKDDVDLFKKITIGDSENTPEKNSVIMGRTTWDSLPEQFKPLPNRNNVVVSKSYKSLLGADVAQSYDEAVTLAEQFGKEVFIIGGAQLYAEALQDPRLLHMYISHIKSNYRGNVLFPDFRKVDWNISEEKEFPEFIFRKYQRRFG